MENRSTDDGSPVAQIRIARPTDRLEFTHHESGSPCPAPTKDNLLVFYVEDDGAFRETAARLRRHGHEPVAPENPYWAEEGLTFEDPDGWRVVLMHAGGI